MSTSIFKYMSSVTLWLRSANMTQIVLNTVCGFVHSSQER